MTTLEDIQIVLKLHAEGTVPADLVATALHAVDACLTGAEQAELRSIAADIPQIHDDWVASVMENLHASPGHGLQLRSSAADAILLSGVMGAEALSRLLEIVRNNHSADDFATERLEERIGASLHKRHARLVEEIIRRLRDSLSQDLASSGVETRVDVGKGTQTGLTSIYIVIECVTGEFTTRRQLFYHGNETGPLRLVEDE